MAMQQLNQCNGLVECLVIMSTGQKKQLAQKFQLEDQAMSAKSSAQA